MAFVKVLVKEVVTGPIEYTDTCWYEHQGKMHVYQKMVQNDKNVNCGLWQAGPEDKALLDTLLKAKIVDGEIYKD